MSDVTVEVLGMAEVVLNLQGLAGATQFDLKVGNSEVVRYAKLVHDGTKPHLIVAKDKGALFWEGAAHPVRAVHHPGTKPNPYLERGSDKAMEAVIALLAERFALAASGGGGNYTQALDAAGKLFVAAMREEAPQGKTGNLKKDLHCEVYRR